MGDAKGAFCAFSSSCCNTAANNAAMSSIFLARSASTTLSSTVDMLVCDDWWLCPLPGLIHAVKRAPDLGDVGPELVFIGTLLTWTVDLEASWSKVRFEVLFRRKCRRLTNKIKTADAATQKKYAPTIPTISYGSFLLSLRA